jgi:D-methionine transport system substrate-binding protein
MNRQLTTLCIAILAALSPLLIGCGRQNTIRGSTGEDKVIRFIMSDADFNSEIVPILKAEVAKQGFVLDWIVVNDIIQPNKLVDDGTADANSFQHVAYFERFVQDHGLKNVTQAFSTFFLPSGLFSRRYKALADVPDGATFGIPVDPANNGRALFMLRDKGLLKLKAGLDVVHTRLKDITENPHGYKFKEVDQLMLQRALDDVDVGFLFTGKALKIGFDPKKDALALEGGDVEPYHGIVAVRKDLAGTPKIKALQNAYGSEALKSYYRGKYGDAILFLDHLNR